MSGPGGAFAERCVAVLCCRFCRHVLSSRGMRAALLAAPGAAPDLYSTDIPPAGANVLLWGNLPDLEENADEDVSCISEEEYIR